MRTVIQTKQAPSPIGAYNQAILSGDTLYISGQIALNVASGELVQDSIEDETKQVMQNLKAILQAAEMDFSNVVKSSIFIRDMDHFSAINAVYSEYFEEATAPARETVEVSRLPKSVNVEISMIASR